MDRILVPGLPLQARVGVDEEERARPQAIAVDVELGLDLRAAGASDELSTTVDYEAVCALADEVVRARSFRLIEAVAEAIAAAVLARFDVTEAVVRVRKPAALERWGAPYAQVEVRRGRNG